MARKPQTRWNRFMTAMKSETAQKWSHRSPALIVAGVALYVSYWHIREVADAHTNDVVSPVILPLSVDGLLIVAARYVTRAKTPLGRAFAIIGFILGILATLAGNLLTSDGTPVGTGVATWPALAVIITGVILHWGDAAPKSAPATARKRTAKAPSKPVEGTSTVGVGASTPNGHKPLASLSDTFAHQTT